MVIKDDEIVLDMSVEVMPGYLTRGKKKKTRKSYPGEAVYQKRLKWWKEHKYGEEAARLAASWRLGLPKKRGKKKEWEEVALNNALRLADMRVGDVDYRMRTFDEPEEEAIKHLDDHLRTIDKDQKVAAGKVEKDISIYHKKIQPNIYKVLS